MPTATPTDHDTATPTATDAAGGHGHLLNANRRTPTEAAHYAPRTTRAVLRSSCVRARKGAPSNVYPVVEVGGDDGFVDAGGEVDIEDGWVGRLCRAVPNTKKLSVVGVSGAEGEGKGRTRTGEQRGREEATRALPHTPSRLRFGELRCRSSSETRTGRRWKCQRAADVHGFWSSGETWGWK
jgi:hypothetical protein